MALPDLLAGPILRRTERTRVTIWLATLPHLEVRGEILATARAEEPETVLARADGRSVRLGPALSVHLLTLEPEAGAFPTDELLGYDIELRARGRPGPGRRLRDLGLLDGPGSLAYGALERPSFFIRERLPALRVLHGSCRLLHGAGEDALIAVDEALGEAEGDVARLPSAMFLTGDQIYADDVAGPMIAHVRALASELMGRQDETSVPGMPDLTRIPIGGRGHFVLDRAHFTSARPSDHLMSFGEFAAMYLCAWSDAVWPTAFPSADDALDSGGSRPTRARRKLKYQRQTRHLEDARRALASVRRVLANVPTYMCFDDHDTTDDWNLTRSWRESVEASPSGRRIVANALASYWAFQCWGNDPELFDDDFTKVVEGFLSGSEGVDEDDYDSLMWSFDRWSYFAPTDPPTIVLDTRTQRGYDSPEGGARLLGREARRRVVELVQRSGYRREDPLIIVSPVPVFGFELQERRQKYLVDKVGPYEIDFEAWHSNLRGLVDLMQMLIEEIEPASCLLLSGDVHYGVNARASFSIGDKELLFTQLVSSGQKHAGATARGILNTLGRVLRRDHNRLGWNRPPECRLKGRLADRIMLRAVNSDEWADDSPVFLAPRDVRLLGIEQPPDFRERRVYVRPRGRNSSILVGENNTGLVSLQGDHVEHRLLSRGRTHRTEHVAEMTMDRRGLEEP